MPHPHDNDLTICIGAAHWDIVARAGELVLRGADVPGCVLRSPGGVALNVAMALLRHGRPAVLLAAIGSDAEGDALVAELDEAGIRTGYLTRLTGMTDSYVAIEDGGGDIVAAVADCRLLERAAQLTLAALGDGRLAGPETPWPGWVVLDGNLPTEIIETIATNPCLAESRLALIGASEAKAPRLAAGLAHPRARLYLNRREAERLCRTEFSTSRAAALALRARGAAEAAVTDGAAPAAFAATDGIVIISPERIAAPSLTGAGDVLVAAHLAAEARGCTPDQAFAEAVAAAGRHVTRLAS